MKRQARWLVGFALGVVAIALIAELMLQLLPVSTATRRGYHHDPDILTYPPNHRWRMATGWDLRNSQEMRSNSLGFAAEREFTPDPSAVALVGDSYVEASMLEAADRPAAQLQSLLGGGRVVYAFGSPGTALLDHAQRIRLARQRAGVQDIVLFLERFDARQSLCGSGNVDAHCLDPVTWQRRIERVPPPGLVRSVLRHSALAQYFGGQIRATPRHVLKSMFTRATPDSGGGPEARIAMPVEPAVAERTQRLV